MRLPSDQLQLPSQGQLFCCASLRRAHVGFSLALLLLVTGLATAAETATPASASSGLTYTNWIIRTVPWSIHVVQLDRANPHYQIESVHAQGGAVGLDMLSDQLRLVSTNLGMPVAAINGDYYQRNRMYAGAPRGLQVTDGELISGPSDGPSVWIDAQGELHAEKLAPQFQLTWPDGTVTPFHLNGERRQGGVELYTRAVGASTHTMGGTELLLTRAEGSPWLPLRLGHTYSARVRLIREGGNSPIGHDVMVVSVGPAALRQHLAQIQPGAVLKICTDSQPALHGIRTAISGGPLLIRDGKRERLGFRFSESYQVSSMGERHPRAAIGWNKTSFFLVEVDGRQWGLSVGMTLDELSKFMINLGCDEAMNLDGGGSATLWYDGEVRNSPCDRMEREIANCLVIVKKRP
jgi:large repetitive protein